MTITLDLSPELEARINTGARHRGIPIEDYICQVLDRSRSAHVPNYRDSLPADVVWEGTVPLIPGRGRTEPITDETVKAWINDDECSE